ncbi:MAG: hypothetical protein ACI4L9_06510 [Candidatus Coproplasma sp.]
MPDKNDRDKKNNQKDELDTETTIVNMNVDGFSWYDPNKDKRTKQPKVSRKEYWQMVRGAFAAFAPFFVVLLLTFGIVVTLAYIWLS